MSDRNRRVAAEIQRSIVPLLRNLKDPRINGLVTISGVRVSRDLSVAKVFVTLLQGGARDQVIEGLRNAAGFLGIQLGKSMTLKKMPRLEFYYDESFEEGAKIDRLLNRLRVPGDTASSANGG